MTKNLKDVDGINHEKIEELCRKISALLQGEPTKEIIIALCFMIARVEYKYRPSQDSVSRDEAVLTISNLIKDYLQGMYDKEGAEK